MTRRGRGTSQDTSGEEQQADGVEAFGGGLEMRLERKAEARSPRGSQTRVRSQGSFQEQREAPTGFTQGGAWCKRDPCGWTSPVRGEWDTENEKGGC